MKKSGIVLLWVGGLWAVVCLLAIASEGRWASGLAVMLAGWLVCGLVWVSLRKWPKSSVERPGLLATLKRVKTRFPSVVVPGLGYALALVFLLAWMNARAQIGKERGEVQQTLSRIVTGQVDMFDCVALQEPMKTRCASQLTNRVPVDDLPQELRGNDSWAQAYRDTQQCYLIKAMFLPDAK